MNQSKRQKPSNFTSYFCDIKKDKGVIWMPSVTPTGQEVTKNVFSETINSNIRRYPFEVGSYL